MNDEAAWALAIHSFIFMMVVALLKRLIFLLGLAVFFVLVGCGGEETAVSTPTPDPQVQQGQAAFVRECGACHSLSPDTVIVGPSLANIGSRASSQVDGQDAQTYLLTSIIRPSVYLVEGFEDKMPANFGKKLTGEEIDAIVAYLLTIE